jgi:putative solute:sodium symporter small subunit
MPVAPLLPAAGRRLDYWQRVRRLTGLCLLAWFGVTFLVIFYARELDAVIVFGWPLSFYMAAQGLTLVYVLICGVYALAMRKSDQLFRGAAINGE